MANHKSAQKRASQNEIRRLRNKAVKTRVKNVTKNLYLAVDNGSVDQITETLNVAKSVIDSTVKKGVLHRKTASRKVSRLSKMVRARIADL